MRYIPFVLVALITFACGKDKPVVKTQAKFAVSGFDQSVPCVITFTNGSSNATGQTWYFGDGSQSTERNPTHTYTTIGDYYIKLKVTGPTGVDSVCSILSLNQVIPGRSTFAYFRDKCSGVPANISFASLNPLSQYYYWDFGAGQTALIKNPIVNIPSAGTYPIKFSSQINGIRDTTVFTLVVN
ncbi:MAG: PKD domain-containing protein [Bacteroidota bacterium]